MATPITGPDGANGASGAQICLASGSPRRRELLAQIGVRHSVQPVDVDETPVPGEAAADFVVRLAIDKARAARGCQAPTGGLPVLAADTAVVVDGMILGKPRDRDDGLAMLGRLSGRSHQVLTGVALIADGLERTALSTSRVRFRRLSAAEAATYWATGEPADKAGCYAIQGLGALFIAELAGSYSGVMGLPLFETAELLDAAGIHLLGSAV
ncbi:MAF protein [Thioflavicoccus mobilis 8321]|uniref:dTTP/UTP pyrophosphatase n=1 Tax=Thioflavicoccus mobilis 8321 TaxID=765912 RepID=L0GX27_9GAMM|nr:Maf family protein [Thioflavicoccus mobilis]AGA91323.1 MAF protein [Thioflavicoccus mobilis 8321]